MSIASSQSFASVDLSDRQYAKPPNMRMFTTCVFFCSSRPGGDQPGGGGVGGGGDNQYALASREEIMMVLDNIEHFLIKYVGYVFGNNITSMKIMAISQLLGGISIMFYSFWKQGNYAND